VSASVPSDVDPNSGCRLPLPRREDLDAEGQAQYDTILKKGPGAIRGLKGPSGIQLHSPVLARLAQPLNIYLRYDAGFGGRVREIAILATARECDSQFEWAAHEPEALKEGLSPALIEVIRHRRPLTGVAPEDATIIALGREMFGDRKVQSETYAKALSQFGRRGLVDLVALMAQYAATAAVLTAFDMQLDPGTEPGLPPRRSTPAAP
jgi:4-carboxymuconolactone decarboxylase